MGIFGFSKKEAEMQVVTCACGAAEAKEACSCGQKVSGGKNIKVLGSGCKSCHMLYENALAAAAGTDAAVEYITDMPTIMRYGVMSMPALVIDEQVVSVGRVLKPADIQKLMGR